MAFIFLVMIFSCFIFIATRDNRSNSRSIQCSYGDPEIQFPFWVTFRQPHDCNSSGFELICREDATPIRFQSYGDLEVKSSFSISTSTSHPSITIMLFGNYTNLNCLAPLLNPFTDTPCLCGVRFHVYTVNLLEFIVALVALVSITIYRSREQQKLKKEQELEAHKYLTDS
ncbi:hypothetical protein ACJRO7_018591 [Eucalyptus globulus]|uniref:Wall-associated receptor kinase galacturonan-binding domain-containing protein n=1 Tax=Eucalyptus globulus TaxID=34317 RepID=A0ABD3KU91_EUCGL